MKINPFAYLPEGPSPSLNELGIWTLHGHVGLGVVTLLETRDREILVIRKAPRDGYEFSGKLALPGGMIRSRTGDGTGDLSADLDYTVLDRLQNETGVQGYSLQHLEPIPIPPIVTSYTAKGERRHTLVLPYQGRVTEKIPLQSRVSSVQEPQWMHWEQIASLLEETAPANRLILASYLWERMTPVQKDAISATVKEAASISRVWAYEAGLASLSLQNLFPLEPDLTQ